MKFINKIKILIIICVLVLIMPVFAHSSEIILTTEMTQEFKKWNDLSEEEKKYIAMPGTFAIEFPENAYKLESNQSTNILKTFVQIKNNLGSSKAKLEKYNLIEDIEIEVKNQGITSQCWAFSTLSSMETNLALTKGIKKEFSERHMAYATSRKFIDGINEKGYNKNVNQFGGLQGMALSYLTNGQGAVLEEKMPFENNENEIYLNQIDIENDTYVSDYELLPTIYKNYDNSGNLIYSNGNGIKYTKEEVNKIREEIKEHIVKYGAITAVTASQELKYYNNEENLANATAYYCNDENIIRDHAVTIVGWDDNYSKENFNPNIKPSSNGAYIVLNSYGENVFDSGYMYISYEDILIETSLYGISGTSDEKYNNIYQHDFFGGIANMGTTSRNVGYYANIYNRNTKEDEILTKIGVNICDYVKLNIYVNPNGEDITKLTKVATTQTLTPGYHTIDISDINLTSEKFAVVVEQISENNKFIFVLETNIEGTVYDVVTAEKGNSKISFDGNMWYNLSDLGTISGIDTTKSDICIKAFTKKLNESEQPTQPEKPNEPEVPAEENIISSKIYKIEKYYIKNIKNNTRVENFIKDIQAKTEMKIFENNKEISKEDTLKTGMILKVGESEYKIVVTGDINGDGKISLVDISKLVLHYSEQKGFVLNNEYKEAGDINQDNKISLLDISKLIILFNEV